MNIRFEVPMIPPSVNARFCGMRNGKFVVNSENKKFQELVVFLWRKKGIILRPPEKKSIFKLRIHVHSPQWLTKEGLSRKVDISNIIKCAEDAFCLAIGIDDKLIWDVQAAKIVSREQATVFLLDLITDRATHQDHAFGRAPEIKDEPK